MKATLCPNLESEIRDFKSVLPSSLIPPPSSLLFVAPFGLALLHEGADALLRVLGLHQLVQVEVFDPFEGFEEGAAARRIQRAARRFERGGGELAQAREKLLKLRFELRRLDDVADEPHPQRLRRVEEL